MPSMQTLFRATVMIVVGAVGFKAWKLYGPTNDELRSTLSQVVHTVQTLLKQRQPSAPFPDPRPPALPTSPELLVAAPSMSHPPAPLTEAPQLLPEPSRTPPAPIVAGSTSAGALAEAPVVGDKPQEPVCETRTQQLLARLAQLGASQPKLAPWGDGQLYRFSCRAPLANAPTMSKHFESIAPEPARAVEEVLAKVETWQLAQHQRTIRR